MAENSRILKISPFIGGEDHRMSNEIWTEWIDELELELRFLEITDPQKKKDALLLYGGKEIRKLEKNLTDPETGDRYEKLMSKLSEHFAPKKNIYYNRYIFLKMRPEPGESTGSYAARLREKTVGCDFHNDNERILEHLIQTSENEELIRKVIYKKLDLPQTLAAMQLIEDTSRQVKEMSQGGEIAKINRRSDTSGLKRHSGNYQANEKCRYCDRKHPKKKELCPAWGKTCS
ncbi:uncharacterized protein LOC123530556 [Mercenaria mercenaria]|uniref:uncharacterized protein LOC123530556 n=1 Tax=Mercenaria mercenaria TaxID=6596 RepID=UPI00234F0675|nr:uncharacterized protein LOC123530556 [Mercenaria mercenaria]